MTALDHHTDATAEHLERHIGRIEDGLLAQSRQRMTDAKAITKAAIDAHQPLITAGLLTTDQLWEDAQNWGEADWAAVAYRADLPTPTTAVQVVVIALLRQHAGIQPYSYLPPVIERPVCALVSWLAEHPTNAARLEYLDCTNPDAPEWRPATEAIEYSDPPHPVQVRDAHPRPLASVPAPDPEPDLTSCTSCDLTVPTADTEDSGSTAEPGWFCDDCAFHRHERTPTPVA